MTMKTYEILSDRPVSFARTGKFEALNEAWKHEDYPLEDYELIVVIRDVLYLQYDQKRYVVNEGEMLLLPPTVVLSNRRIGYKASKCSFYWMHFSPKGETGIDKTEKLILPESMKLLQPERVAILLRQLQDGLRNGYDANCMDYFAMSVLCEVAEQLHRQQNGEKTKKTQKQIYHDIEDYVRSHATTYVTVEEIAEHFGYNTKYLSHMFREISGIPLKQYLLRCKVDEANYMLSETNLPVNLLAEAVGFRDSNNFMKCYKKMTGLTPTQYRNAFCHRNVNHS